MKKYVTGKNLHIEIKKMFLIIISVFAHVLAAFR